MKLYEPRPEPRVHAVQWLETNLEEIQELSPGAHKNKLGWLVARVLVEIPGSPSAMLECQLEISTWLVRDEHDVIVRSMTNKDFHAKYQAVAVRWEPPAPSMPIPKGLAAS